MSAFLDQLRARRQKVATALSVETDEIGQRRWKALLEVLDAQIARREKEEGK